MFGKFIFLVVLIINANDIDIVLYLFMIICQFL